MNKNSIYMTFFASGLALAFMAAAQADVSLKVETFNTNFKTPHYAGTVGIDLVKVIDERFEKTRGMTSAQVDALPLAARRQIRDQMIDLRSQMFSFFIQLANCSWDGSYANYQIVCADGRAEELVEAMREGFDTDNSRFGVIGMSMKSFFHTSYASAEGFYLEAKAPFENAGDRVFRALGIQSISCRPNNSCLIVLTR